MVSVRATAFVEAVDQDLLVGSKVAVVQPEGQYQFFMTNNLSHL